MNDAEREYQEKLSLLSELIKLAQVDEALKQSEHDFLEIIAQQLGVEKDDFEQLFETFITFTPPRLEGDRIVQFQRLILVMHVDQEVDDKQLHFIRDLGIRMGLNPMATEEVLRVRKNYPHFMIPPQELIKIFMTYHN